MKRPSNEVVEISEVILEDIVANQPLIVEVSEVVANQPIVEVSEVVASEEEDCVGVELAAVAINLSSTIMPR